MAQAATDFSSILSKAPSDVEKPKPLPVGSYVVVVRGQPKFDKSTKKQTPYVEFTYGIMAPGEDVDSDDLKAYGPLADKTMRDTYYLTENSLWRLKEMLSNCGLDEDDYETMQEMVEATPGKQLMINIKHEASQDGTAVFANVGSTAPVE